MEQLEAKVLAGILRGIVEMQKRILVVTNMYPSEKYPHYGVFVQYTAEVLRSEGFCVDIVAMSKEISLSKKLLAYIQFYSEIMVKGLRNNYDALYTHYASHTALPLLLLSKIKKRKLVVNVHGNDVVPETTKDEKFIPLVRKLLNKADAIVCPSEYFREILEADFHITEKKILVYPSGGVNTSIFRKTSKEQAACELGLGKDGRYIGYVSRIEEKKGWDLFLEVAVELKKKYPFLRFIVVGDGDQAEQYERLVKALGLETDIVKYQLLPQNKVAAVFNILDVFVFPTYRKSESLGLVGLEAMACQVPVVLPDKYGPSSYCRDKENAYVFRSGDAQSLLCAVECALQEDNKQLIENAYKTALKYTHDTTASIICDFFNRLC